MKLVVGLGNVGKEYENTYHNLGFLAVDALCERLGFSFKKTECQAITACGTVNGEKVLLAKPTTYMNASGDAVAALLSYYKIPVENLLVLYDDFDLPVGAVRIRPSGSAGTHNGMKSLLERLKTESFKRVRIGFHTESPIPLLTRVLMKITPEDKDVLARAVSRAADAAQAFTKNTDFEEIMRTFSGAQS